MIRALRLLWFLAIATIALTFAVAVAPVGRAGFTIDETAAYLAASRSTVKRLLKAGELTSFKIGSARRIIPESVDAYVARQVAEAA